MRHISKRLAGEEGMERSVSAIILFNGITIRAANDDMKEYIKDTSLTCRRTALLRHFDSSPKSKPLGYNCCDKCVKTCKCKDGGCDVNLYLPVPETICIYKKQCTLTEEEKEKLHRMLCLLHKNILMTTSSSPSDHIGFPTSCNWEYHRSRKLWRTVMYFLLSVTLWNMSTLGNTSMQFLF